MQQSPDDFLAELGVIVSSPAKIEKATKRHTAWTDTVSSFVFGGYLAKVKRITCATCECTHDELIGIFTEELATNGGNARRLTQLSRNAQWPTNVSHRFEVSDQTDPYCIHCIKELGFDHEVNRAAGYSMHIGTGENDANQS